MNRRLKFEGDQHESRLINMKFHKRNVFNMWRKVSGETVETHERQFNAQMVLNCVQWTHDRDSFAHN